MGLKVADAKTGKIYILDETEELTGELRTYWSTVCRHDRTETREVKVSGGSSQIRDQCMACGDLVGNPISRTKVPLHVLAKDESIQATYRLKREVEYQAILQRHVRQQQSQYEAYLRSHEWKSKRAKVLKRAKGLCEGCLDRPPAEVHHRTYDHKFNEFMFELIALCRECHERIHTDAIAGEANLSDLGAAPTINASAAVADPAEFDFCGGCRWHSEENYRPWCGKFGVYAADALLADGDCGLQQSAFEPLR